MSSKEFYFVFQGNVGVNSIISANGSSLFRIWSGGFALHHFFFFWSGGGRVSERNIGWLKIWGILLNMRHVLFVQDMTHLYVTWLFHTRILGVHCKAEDLTHSCETYLICTRYDSSSCDMTHSCVWHDSFICVTWLIHMCDVTHS